MCKKGPILIVNPGYVMYGNLKIEDMSEIVQKHLIDGRPVARLTIEEDHLYNRFFRVFGDVDFFGKQMRITLRNCGIIDPENIDDYLSVRGYEAIARVLTELKPKDVIAEVKKAGIRGRGGAGFPTGLKWEFTANQDSDEKYVICNADEGDPGAFMDRSAIEGDPHTVLEGIIIGGYAIGAKKGIVYIRAEYPLAIKRLELAIAAAKEYGFLGDNILGSDFSFDIEIRLGAGAFVCGEETALIHSIEGSRGMPRPRPPYPSVSGLFGKPTLINNVETWANIPVVILDGGGPARGRKYLLWLERFIIPAWSKCRWEPPCVKSSMTSAAVSRTVKHSKLSKPVALAAVVCRKNTSTLRLTTNRWPRPVRLWALAG
jgi:(2Fe-2S) ferredoxin